MVESLTPVARADIAGLRTLLPPPTVRLEVRILEGLRVIELQTIATGDVSLAALFSRESLLPLPGQFTSTAAGTWLAWRSPHKTLLVTSNDETADAVLSACERLLPESASAIDISAGGITFELHGTDLDGLLSRLIDAHAIPRDAGACVRARMGDVAVIAMRLAADRLMLLADRSLDAYVLRWLRFAAGLD